MNQNTVLSMEALLIQASRVRARLNSLPQNIQPAIRMNEYAQALKTLLKSIDMVHANTSKQINYEIDTKTKETDDERMQFKYK
ncbi:MAG: hypothetical protein M0R38_11740 [Bacteroidia bacterium]|nr:hypothetical protein [Bacteroidia bacterium]